MRNNIQKVILSYRIILVILLFLIFSKTCIAQKDTLYLLTENPFFIKNQNTIITGFGIKSIDKRFNLDYYQFQVQNYLGWDEKGNDIYLSLDELRKEVKLDAIKYETKVTLQKDKEWWEIHNELSLKSQIFLLEKRKEFNADSKEYEYKYYTLPMLYEGTRKNIVPTDLSFKRE